MDNYGQNYCLFGDELLHSRLTDCHHVTYLNLSSVAHEISSVEAPKGGKYEDNLCMDTSFLQQPSQIYFTRIF